MQGSVILSYEEGYLIMNINCVISIPCIKKFHIPNSAVIFKDLGKSSCYCEVSIQFMRCAYSFSLMSSNAKNARNHLVNIPSISLTYTNELSKNKKKDF